MTDSLKSLESWINEWNRTAAPDDQIETEINSPMSRHTTFRIGGPAALYLTPNSVDALLALIRQIRMTGVKFFLLGNGSNVLFPDEGYDGAVVSLGALRKISVNGREITAEAGALLIHVCRQASDAGLSGLEFAYGIPGSVGGAVFMNAGAYDGEISFVLRESTYLDLDTLTVHTITQPEHAYGYRDSVYRHTNRLILSATFSLADGDREAITAKMNDFMSRRVAKQPLEYPSAGSVFKRCAGHYTGQMIEEAGLKGYTIGGAQVSEKHAGFIINVGGATAEDVTALIEHIRRVILEKFGCELECEVIRIS